MRIALNILKRDNYVFFDPETLVHLSLSRPIVNVTKLSDSIMRGIRGGSLIDIDLKSGIEFDDKIQETRKYIMNRFGLQEEKPAAPVEPKEESKQEAKEDVVEESKTKKSKKAKSE